MLRNARLLATLLLLAVLAPSSWGWQDAAPTPTPQPTPNLSSLVSWRGSYTCPDNSVPIPCGKFLDPGQVLAWQFTCGDPNNCTVVAYEVTAVTGQVVIIYAMTSKRSVTLQDTPNAVELAGGAAWVGGVGDTVMLVYTGTTWAEVSRSNN